MATSASKAEATGTNITFEYEGNSYEIIPTSEWTIEVMEAMEDGKVTYILRNILAGDGYKRFRDTKPTVTKVTEFFIAAQEHLGAAGN